MEERRGGREGGGRIVGEGRREGIVGEERGGEEGGREGRRERRREGGRGKGGGRIVGVEGRGRVERGETESGNAQNRGKRSAQLTTLRDGQ